MATVQEFEENIWELEGIRIIIRASEGAQIADYDYQNAAQNGWSVTKWLQSRVSPCIGSFQVTVIQGNGEEPNGRTLIRNVKSSYHTQL